MTSNLILSREKKEDNVYKDPLTFIDSLGSSKHIVFIRKTWNMVKGFSSDS